MTKEKRDEKIKKLKKAIINSFPDHSPRWKEETIKELEELIRLSIENAKE